LIAIVNCVFALYYAIAGLILRGRPKKLPLRWAAAYAPGVNAAKAGFAVLKRFGPVEAK
jgi:hypothetical protein